MSDVSKSKTRTSVRRQRSIYQVHYCLERRRGVEMKPLVLPSDLGVQAFDLQVAGHQSTNNSKYMGLLQCSNGTILKPILKPCQQREVDFYTRLQTTDEPDLLELRKLVPKYFGRTHYTYQGHQQEYIVLEDLTQRMMEQCVMDVKIGRRTWDPLATEEKIKNEQNKYALCKQQYGFCIPGYQVVELATGRVRRYGKDHGKKLHGDMVKDAIRRYLNGCGSAGICRSLLLQLLASLWRVQDWARHQTRAKLYCTSLLLLYDATKLRACCESRAKCSTPPSRRSSVTAPPSGGGPLGGQLAPKGPLYKLRPPRPAPTPTPDPPLTSPWTEAYDKMTHNHSFDHNYEENLTKMKADYRTLLEELSSDLPTPNTWATVKIIDFAHVFFNEDDEKALDDNFREGIDNFVAIFESFLKKKISHHPYSLLYNSCDIKFYQNPN
ncbi:hypothetical protein evm_008205 [Chilo suppressalis]|nr:hypothetical protein evm_008205 [Chilo suppressalis]